MKNTSPLPYIKWTFLSILNSFQMSCRRRILFLTWLTGLTFICSVANASIHYVGIQGTDASGAGIEQLPFQTIQFAYNQANSTDTIILLPGVHHQQFTFSLTKNVVLASKYLLTQDTSFISTTIIDGSQYFGASALIEIYGGASNVAIIGLTIRNSTAKALIVQNSGSSYLSECYLFGNGNVSVWGTFTTSNGFAIRNSRFLENRGRYIVNGPMVIDRCYFEGNGQGQNAQDNAVLYPEHNGAKTRIQYSYFTGNHIPCIAGGGNANGLDSVEVFNNTIVNNFATGFYAQNWSGGQKFFLSNNIVEGNSPNLYFNNMGYSHLFFRNNYISPFSKNVDPNPLNFFVSHQQTDSSGNGGLVYNQSNGLFELASSSKLIGAGAIIAGLNTDFLGRDVPWPINTTPDLGAIENNAGAPIIVFDSIQPVCSSEPNFLLDNASPQGGTYSGHGVINGLTFSPSLAGFGNHTILYTFVNANNVLIVDSFQIEVLFAPLVQLSMVGDSVLCAGGSTLLVADSVPGANYRWIQEDGIVGGLMVEVFSTHAGVGSSNDYPGYPTSRAEFDKFFDTTYQSTSLHYQGRHNALQSLNWSGMSALTNVGIAVPNNGDFFAVQVSGFFNPSETGTYRFNASSDDAMDFIIGDSLVLSSYMANNGQINLQAGQRVFFKARMQEYGGHESFNLSWEKPSQLNTGNWQLDTLELNGSRGAVVLSDTGRSITASESGIYRAEVTTSTGCTVRSNGLQIEVLPLPVVTLASFDPVCLTDSVTIPLTGGWPTGGVYSGTGVSNGVFDPLVAGSGIHEISYTYTDSLGNGCTKTATQQMVVLPLTVNVQVDDYCAPSQAVASIADSSVYCVQWYRNNQLIQEQTFTYAFTGQTMLTGLIYPYDMVVDAQGNRYVVEMQSHRVIRYAPGQQTFTVVAGGNGNGTELNQLHNPTGMAVDASGNVFVADHSNHRIVRWTPGALQGVVVAGSALGISGNATNQLHNPYHLKFDNQGRLYVTDINNSRVMRYAATISTTTSVMSGTVIVGSAGAGSANNQLSGPYALFVDSQANRMYVSDDGNARIMRYDLTATNVANSGTRVAGGNGQGSGLNQFSHHIAGILVEGGEIYLADLHGERIMRWREGGASGQVIAGGVGYGSQLFRTSRPTAVRIDAEGNLEYLERDHGRLVRFDANKLNSDTLAFTEAGVYRAEFKRFGTSCVSASADFTINKPIAQISSSGGATVCEGDTTTLSTTAQTGYVYQWYKNGQSIAGAISNTFSTSVPGSYTVETGDSSGCFHTSEAFVIHAEPQVALTADGLCLGSMLQVSTADSSVVGFDWVQNGIIVKQVRAGFEEEGEVFVASNSVGFGLNQPFDLATDHMGNIYYSEHGNHRVMRRAPDGTNPVVVAGNGIAGAGLSSLDRPTGIFVDAAFNVYVADMGNHRVVKWAPGATQGELVAGTTGVAGSTLARLNEPMDVVVDDLGAVYVADKNNHRVVRWMPNATSGVLFAGTGTYGSSINQLYEPHGLAIWMGGVYIADHWNSRVIRVFNGINTVVATNLPNGDLRISSVHVDKTGAIYLSEMFNNRVVRWFPGASTGEVVAGGNSNGNAANQLGLHIYGITTDLQGNLYVADDINQRIMKYNRVTIEIDSFVPTASGSYGLITHTVQGCSYQHSVVLPILSPEVNLTSTSGYDLCEGDTTQLATIQNATYTYQWYKDGLQIAGATSSGLTAFEPGLYHVEVLDSNACSKTSESMRIWPKPVATLTADGLCLGSELITNVPTSDVVQISWCRNNQIVKVLNRPYELNGNVKLGYFNGWVSDIDLSWGINGFHIDQEGSIFILSPLDQKVLKYIPATGTSTVVAGGNGEGSAINQLWSPQGFFVTPTGDIFIADTDNHRVVKWSKNGIVSVVAGVTGVSGSQLTHLNSPYALWVDAAENIYISDYSNNRVVKWPPNASSGQLVLSNIRPLGLYLTDEFNLFVSDFAGHKVVLTNMMDMSSKVVAGGNGMGAALNQLAHPHGLFVDNLNNLYVADAGNNRVVKWDVNSLTGRVLVGGNGNGYLLSQTPSPKNVFTAMNGDLFVTTSSNQPRLLHFELAELPADTLFAENPGNYHVKMRTLQGCENNSQSHAIFAPEVSLSSSRGFDVCEGDTTILSTAQNSTYTYQWFKDGLQIAGATASNLTAFEPGLYHVEVIDSNACSRISESMLIWPKPQVSIATDGLCYGSELRTNLPDSNVSHIAWYRDGHRIEVVARPHKDTATILLGMINNQWINGIRMPATLRDLLLGPDGAIYFTDSHAVYRYTESIGLVQVAGGSNRGSGLNQLSNPSGLFLQNNAQLYIADAGNHRVVKWTLGDTVGVLMAGVSGQQGSALTHLNLPTKLFLDHQNNLFIADWANNRVVKWNNGANSGQIVAGGTGYGSALNQLTYPEDIFVNGDGSLYVSDVENHRVLKFLPGSLNGQIVAGHGGIGSGLNQFLRPQKIYIDEFENVFVADLWNHRIVKYNHGAISGEIVAGGYGSGDQPYHVPFPKSFAFGTGHSLYVASEQYSPFGSNFSRILRFDLGPNLSSDTLTARLGGAYSAEFTTKFGCKSSSNVIDISEPMLVFPLVNNLCVSDAGLDLNMASPAGGTYYGTGVDTGYFHPAIAGVGSHKIYYLLIDSNGCSKLDSQTIQVVAEPIVSIDTIVGSLNMCRGESVTLQAPLVSGQTYQWYRNGVLIPQATQRSYTVRDSVSAQYHVMVTRNVCVKSSDTLSVIVRPKPVVTIANPGASTICQGDIAILQATSDTDMTYQWYRNNLLIAGENGPTLSTGQAGTYHSVVLKSNGCRDTSNVLSIQVLPAAVATIDTIIGNLNMCFGESVTLQSALVSGQTYQWYRNGVLIPQATQRSYTVRDSVSAQYHVMVTRNVCEKSSDTLFVVVRPKPVVSILNQGASAICQGDSVILEAASDTDVTYQWYLNGQVLVGSTQSNLVANQSGSYTCQVIKANGCADTSNVLALTVLDYPIAQITPVGATTVCVGQAVVLNANLGTGLTYRWFRNGTLIPGATAASYQVTQSGDYTVEVKRQQLCETISQAVTVVVNPLPQISIALAQGNQFCSGDSILITAQSPSQVLRYAWFFNGQLLQNNSTATIYASLPGYYHAQVFDTAGCDKVSDSVQVSYFDPPFANETICAISVDTLTGRNVVVWEKTSNVRTAFYNVYREGAVSGQYNLIGRVPFDSLSIFIDTTANPLSQSYRYRIASEDSCGFVSTQSAVHRTIHLSSNIGVNNEVNLFWTTYEGVNVPTHRILRSINGGPFSEIASVSGTTFTYTDLTPPQGTKNYLIEISIPGGCNPTGLRVGDLRTASNYSSIQSNKVAVGSGVSVLNLGTLGLHSIYPNPSNGLFTLVRSEQRLTDKVFKIYDARGRLVKTIRFDNEDLAMEIDMKEEADGVYTIRSNDSDWSLRFIIAK